MSAFVEMSSLLLKTDAMISLHHGIFLVIISLDLEMAILQMIVLIYQMI